MFCKIILFKNICFEFILGTELNQTEFVKNIGENVTTKAYLKRIDGRLDYLEEMMKELIDNSCKNQTNQTLDNDFLSLFPLNSIASIKSMNDRIMNNDHDFELLVVR